MAAVRTTGSSRKQRALSQLQQGTYGTSGERLHWSYYDTYTMATGTPTFSLFQAPIGQNSKTIGDTNMTTAGTLPQGQNMAINCIKIQYTSVDAFDAAALLAFNQYLNNAIVEFVINNKAPMWQSSLGELIGATLNTSQTTATVSGSNVNFLTGVYRLHVPIRLGALVPFQVRITNTVASAAALDGDKVKVSLNGRLIRAI